jgi:hypothetical protein
VLDRVNRCDGFSMKKPFRSSARGASVHTKHASNANVVRVVLLDANSHSEHTDRGAIELLYTAVTVIHSFNLHTGGASVRGARARDPVPHVPATGGLYGHPTQKWRRREAPLQIRTAERVRRHRLLLHHIP